MAKETRQKNKFFGPDYYGEQDENGVDLSQIRENLKLTPLDRIRKADAARRQALRLLEYGRRHRDEGTGNQPSSGVIPLPWLGILDSARKS